MNTEFYQTFSEAASRLLLERSQKEAGLHYAMRLLYKALNGRLANMEMPVVQEERAIYRLYMPYFYYDPTDFDLKLSSMIDSCDKEGKLRDIEETDIFHVFPLENLLNNDDENLPSLYGPLFPRNLVCGELEGQIKECQARFENLHRLKIQSGCQQRYYLQQFSHFIKQSLSGRGSLSLGGQEYLYYGMGRELDAQEIRQRFDFISRDWQKGDLTDTDRNSIRLLIENALDSHPHELQMDNKLLLERNGLLLSCFLGSDIPLPFEQLWDVMIRRLESKAAEELQPNDK